MSPSWSRTAWSMPLIGGPLPACVLVKMIFKPDYYGLLRYYGIKTDFIKRQLAYRNSKVRD